MDDETKMVVYTILVIAISLVGLITAISGGVYYYHKLQISNFQATIKDLSEEQKCLHICGFQFDGYLESYKFCVEKCDRISERSNMCKLTT